MTVIIKKMKIPTVHDKTKKRVNPSPSVALHHSVHDLCSRTDLVDFYLRDVSDVARISGFI